MGVSFDLDALKLVTPLGDLGPAFHKDLDFGDLARVPVYTEHFEMPLGTVAGRPFSVPKANSPAAFVEGARLFRMGGSVATLLGRDLASGLATYRVAAYEADTDSHFEFDVTGVETSFVDVSDSTFDYPQTVLRTDQDVVLNDPVSGQPIANLGRSFCVICPFATDLFDSSLAIDVGADTLHLSPLFEYPTGLVDIQSDAILSQNHYFHEVNPVETILSETIITPITSRGDVLFSNLNEPQRDYSPIPEYWAAQSFTTDGQPYLLRSIQALIGNASDDPDIVAQLFTSDDGFFIDDLLTEFTPPPLGVEHDAYTFVPEQDVLLDPNTVYWFVVGARSGSFDWSYEDSEIGGGANTFGAGSLVLFADSIDAGQNWTYYSLLNPYQMQINVAIASTLPGDVTSDGSITVEDIDAVAAAVRIGDESSVYDLNHDGLVTTDDYDELILNLKQTYFGDANLDREVGFSDFLDLSANFGGPGGWGQGDFDADGNVSFSDFLLLSGNFGKKVSVQAAVPEPTILTSQFFLCLAVLILLARGVGFDSSNRQSTA
jgi:hypothetical protein